MGCLYLVPNVGYIRFSGWASALCRLCRRRKSAQAIILGCQQKSLRKITSASSAPNQTDELVAGLQKVLQMTFNGAKMNGLPQFVSP